MSNQNNIDRVRGKLIKNYPADEIGTWEIRGEDHNCDFGGSHHMPTLGYFNGKYQDVLEYALNLSGFFAWGSGGDISRITIHDIDSESNEKLIKARAELKVAEEQLEVVKAKITQLKGDL